MRELFFNWRNQAKCSKPLPREFERKGDFSPTIHSIFVVLPNVICDFLVHCLGHERAHRIRSFCRHSNGCLLCIGTPTPFLHPRLRILLPSWLDLRLPTRCVAVRTGRTSMVGYCSGKVVVRSEAENPALRVDESNGDLTTIEVRFAVAIDSLSCR